MKFSDVCIPVNAAWSSPFVRWQGPTAEINSLDLAHQVTERGLAERDCRVAVRRARARHDDPTAAFVLWRAYARRQTGGAVLAHNSGDHLEVMLGYWGREQETRDVLTPDGWYRSGDMAYADDAGYLYIVDRLKDMIISGGENVYSAEVEAALYEHPDVAECAVFGVPDPRWGERVHAVVVPRAGAELHEDALVGHAQALIAHYKVPRSVELRAEPLAKTGAGKILKRELRDQHWVGQERQIH